MEEGDLRRSEGGVLAAQLERDVGLRVLRRHHVRFLLLLLDQVFCLSSERSFYRRGQTRNLERQFLGIRLGLVPLSGLHNRRENLALVEHSLKLLSLRLEVLIEVDKNKCHVVFHAVICGLLAKLLGNLPVTETLRSKFHKTIRYSFLRVALQEAVCG